MVKVQDDRLFYVSEAIRRGISIEEIHELTKIDLFFLDKLLHIVEIEQDLKAAPFELSVLKEAKKNGLQIVKLPYYGTAQPNKFVISDWNTNFSLSTKW